MKETATPPWGRWAVLEDDPHYKVKKIEVLPRKRLSYQKHNRRSEHWIVVKGTAKATLQGKEVVLKEGDHIDIPKETFHRIENIGSNPLIFIEIQRGTYLGEDDIIRVEDDYGRTKS